MTANVNPESVWLDLLLLFCTLGTGLMAGLFFVFSNSVINALVRMENSHGVAAMQAINASILNRSFLLIFFGTALLSVVCIAAFLGLDRNPRSFLMLIGGILYLTGGFVVTAAFNVPLNRRLAALPIRGASVQAFWTRYAVVWTRWNHVRTFCCISSLGCYILAASS